MADELPQYTARLRQLPCVACKREPAGTVHHHTGRRGMGQRAHDRDAMPLCPQCHHDLHAHAGRFKHFTREQLQEFQDRHTKEPDPWTF